MNRLVTVFRNAGLRFSQDGCAALAQAIAFNAVFAIFPLLLLGIGTLAFIYGNDAGQQKALDLIADLAPAVKQTLTEILNQLIAARGLSGVISGLIGVIALVWSGKNLFLTLAYALDRALGIPQGRPLVADIVVSILMLPVLGIILIVATLVPIIVSLVIHYGQLRETMVASQVISYGVGALMIFVVSALLYTYLPNMRMGLGFGIPGALVMTAGWEVAQIAFAFYSTHVNFVQVYGAVSAFAVLLLWFYYMGTIFLFGAQVSAQWAALERTPQSAATGVQPRPTT